MATHPEEADSDGSWTWVDNEDDNFRKRAEKRRASSIHVRPEVEEVKESEGDSDFSILTDPEDHPEGEVSAPLTEEQSTVHEMLQHTYRLAAQSEVVESELADIDRRTRAYIHSTYTSIGLMLFGLLLALYCQWGVDNNYSSPIQEYYDEPYESKADIEYIPADFKHGRKYNSEGRKIDAYRHAEKTHKNAKQKYDKYAAAEHHYKKFDDDDKGFKHKGRDEHFKGKQQKKGEFKKDKYRDYEGPKKGKKVKKDHDHKNNNHVIKKEKGKRGSNEHEDYLNKKEAYLKNKESKLKHREYKLYAKSALAKPQYNAKKRSNPYHNGYCKYNRTSSGEWYDKMHKGRKDKRHAEEQSEWVFQRAHGRDKKRDKAHWYFDMMDERESNRMKQRS